MNNIQYDIEWINVLNQLPPISTPVLFCCFPNDFIGCTQIAIGEYTGQKTMGHAVVMDIYDDQDWLPCTHWMPLPKLPKSSL